MLAVERLYQLVAPRSQTEHSWRPLLCYDSAHTTATTEVSHVATATSVDQNEQSGPV